VPAHRTLQPQRARRAAQVKLSVVLRYYSWNCCAGGTRTVCSTRHFALDGDLQAIIARREGLQRNCKCTRKADVTDHQHTQQIRLWISTHDNGWEAWVAQHVDGTFTAWAWRSTENAVATYIEDSFEHGCAAARFDLGRLSVIRYAAQVAPRGNNANRLRNAR
jgi:hypothetical protein